MSVSALWIHMKYEFSICQANAGWIDVYFSAFFEYNRTDTQTQNLDRVCSASRMMEEKH